MNLSDDQKQTIRQWAAEGAGLSEIQKRIREQFKLPLTFMDVRMLALDLKLDLKDAKQTTSTMTIGKAPPPQNRQADALPDDAPEAGLGTVSVTLDRIKKPGAIVSGSVEFSDGVKAAWSLDQYGRLALDAGRPGYAPSQDDVQSFQKELTRLLQQQGY